METYKMRTLFVFAVTDIPSRKIAFVRNNLQQCYSRLMLTTKNISYKIISANGRFWSLLLFAMDSYSENCLVYGHSQCSLGQAPLIASSKRIAFDSSIQYFLFRRVLKNCENRLSASLRTAFCLSVRPRGTAGLPWMNFRDGWNLVMCQKKLDLAVTR